MPDHSLLTSVYGSESLDDLQRCLSDADSQDCMRELLLKEFRQLSNYRNATEWNQAVRLCEALAIIGWGEHEALEAVCGCWVNGNPETFFINRYDKVRFLDAVWSKRKDGVAIDISRSFFHSSADVAPINLLDKGASTQTYTAQDITLSRQRNWIPRNPILITRGLANCYENSKKVIDEMESVLKPALDCLMRPELYGNAVDRIVINCSFSFYDNYHCKTNYIIADEKLRLKQKDFYPKLLEMYSEKEIEDNGLYLRNRFSFGPFRSDSGSMRVGIVLEKEFSQQSHQKQRELLCAYFVRAIEECARRLNKRVDYNFELMMSDFMSILNKWQETGHILSSEE
ncbi:MAG: hypothetical protein K2F63_04815 [Muribaculaceae bacterium]|nr:hypothetical protein [Muribaculaceae bacterium]